MENLNKDGENMEQVYVYQGETLIEVDVGDEPPNDDDSSTVWSEMNDDDDLEEVTEEGGDMGTVEDMSISAFKAHNHSVYCVEIHPTISGLIISGGGDDKGYIWQYSTSLDSQQLGEYGHHVTSFHELSGHSDSVVAVGFSNDGQLAFTGGYDGVIKIWDVKTGQEVATMDGPQDIEWAQWHSKGRAIIAGSSDGTAWIWVEMNSVWQCAQVFAGAHDGGVPSGCFSADGKYVLTGGQDGSIRVWAPKTGKCKHTFSGHFAHSDEVTCIVSNSDGDLVLTGSMDGRVRLFQISGKKVLQTFIHSTPKVITTSGDVSSSSVTDTAGISLPPPPSSSHMDIEKIDNMENIDNFQNDEEEREVSEIKSVECIGFISGEKMVASGGMDRYLKIWDVVSGALRLQCSHVEGVVDLRCHSDLPLVSTACIDHIIRLWDARSGVCVRHFTGHTDIITHIHMSKLPVSSSSSSTIISSNTDDSMSPQMSEASDRIEKKENDTDVIASVSDDGTVRIFHYNAQSLLSS